MLTKETFNFIKHGKLFYDQEAINSYITRWVNRDKNVPNQAFNGVIVSEKVYNKAVEISQIAVPQSETALNDKTIKKWMGPQGGIISLDTMKSGEERYYTDNDGTKPDSCFSDNRWIKDLVTYTSKWLKLNKPELHQGKYIIDRPVTLFKTYNPTHKSSGAIIYQGDRRDRECRVRAIKSHYHQYEYDAIMAEMRYKDGKYRNIHNDPLSNYFRESEVFFYLFNDWNKYYMDHHYSDYEISRIIYSFKASCAYAGDYSGMDFHLNFREALVAVSILYNAFDVEYSERVLISKRLFELFTVELLVGDELWKGLHDLLSGIFPTHTIECILNFANLFKGLVELNIELVPTIRKLNNKKREAAIIVCGDDSIVLFSELCRDDIEKYAELHAINSQKLLQVMELSKVEIGYGKIDFCKKTFAINNSIRGFKYISLDETGEKFPVAKYPLVKAVHALRYPENIPNFSDKTTLIMWFCVIMDCAYGCQNWRSVTTYLIQSNLELFKLDCKGEESQYLDIGKNDWWFRNLSNFSLPTSKTFNLIQTILNK